MKKRFRAWICSKVNHKFTKKLIFRKFFRTRSIFGLRHDAIVGEKGTSGFEKVVFAIVISGKGIGKTDAEASAAEADLGRWRTLK